jgi:para-aminobenzoate synthetase component I
MHLFSNFNISDPGTFCKKLLNWGRDYKRISVLYSNNYRNIYKGNNAGHSYDLIAAIGSVDEMSIKGDSWLESLGEYTKRSGDWLFGHIGYDLKNEIEKLGSNHPDRINFPVAGFFIPEYIFIVCDQSLSVGLHKVSCNNDEAIDLVSQIDNSPLPDLKLQRIPEIKEVISMPDYLNAITKIREHIQRGDIYEVNLCQEFYSEKADIDPVSTWIRLINKSPTPFSCYYRQNDSHLLCSSPERFLKKTGNKIISQPIKGTAARGKTGEEDIMVAKALSSDVKERAENIMIADLVRNDLSRIATRASVNVDELCAVYPFPGVHQMQTTISALLPEEINFTDIIRATFPMGSMTGAPKLRSMEIIEKYEKTRRGLYSGTVGYITPGMDFDFNVVIRSIQYNSLASCLSFMVGGAITSLSVPENEYRECLLKASAIMDVLTGIQ